MLDNPTIGFSSTLANLGPSGGGYIDSVLASGTKAGYVYTYAVTGNPPYTTYTLNVDPSVRNITGVRSFYSDQVNQTHYNMVQPAALTDPALQ